MENNDLDIAMRYVSLATSAKSREIEFTISFSEFKKIFNKKLPYQKLTSQIGEIFMIITS